MAIGKSAGLTNQDLEVLETSPDPASEKLARVINVLGQAFAVTNGDADAQRGSGANGAGEYSHPVVRNVIGALQIIRNAANLEDKVHQQRLQ